MLKRSFIDRAQSSWTLAVVFSLVGLTGCIAPPRAGPEAPQMASAATGVPVTFRAVGPDGGPLDEHETDGESLTLAEALRRAVATDPALQAALARVRIAMAESDQARLWPNPVLNVVLRWGASGKPQVEASLTQDFVRMLQTPRRASAMDHRLRQAASDAVTVAIDLAGEVQERYLGVQASVERLPLLRERAAFVERLVSIARARLDAGEGARGELAAFQAQHVELLVEIDQEVLVEREERLRLARLIGQPSSAAIWAMDRWGVMGTELAPEAQWIDAALAHRPEIQVIAWRLKALSDDEALARWFSWEGAGIGAEAQRDDRWLTGPSVSAPLPIFDSGEARRSRASAEILEARHDLTRIRRKVVEEVRLAYGGMSAGRVNLSRIREELIPLQRQRCALAEDGYRAGQSDVAALLLAELDLRLALVKAIDAERQAAVSMIRLQRAIGGPGVAATVADAPHSSNVSAAISPRVMASP